MKCMAIVSGKSERKAEDVVSVSSVLGGPGREPGRARCVLGLAE